MKKPKGKNNLIFYKTDIYTALIIKIHCRWYPGLRAFLLEALTNKNTATTESN